MARFPGGIRRLAAITVALAAAAALTVLGSAGTAAAAGPPLPPQKANFDYQIGGPYNPAAGVRVITRDHTAQPYQPQNADYYNICYVNAFQAQPGAEAEWGDLVLRNAAGEIVYDEDWNEAFLDIRTDDKRTRIAAKVNAWIDGCAAKGFKGVEPDNYDSFTRAGGLLTAAHAQAFIKKLSAHAHAKNLAIAQKNTPELAGNRVANGLDFAVAEECGQYDECGDYATPFANNVIVIEYTNGGMTKACNGWKTKLSIVQRDVGVVPAGSGGYVRKVC